MGFSSLAQVPEDGEWQTWDMHPGAWHQTLLLTATR